MSSYLYKLGKIKFRARDLPEAFAVARRLDELIRAELGERAEGFVTLGLPSADDSNFAPSKPRKDGAA